jgi:mono/diheme cytochrome c family protein
MPVAVASAQHAAPTTPRSTQTGVYTAAQAARGQDLYAGMCQSCHTPISHSDAAFQKTWNGRPLWALFLFIHEMMPKNDPGSLTPAEVSDVIAYMLKLNRMPPGRHELPTDSASLKIIRTETTSSAVDPSPPR